MRKTLIITLFIAILLAVANIGTVHALTISPAKLELSADPGKTINGQFILINEQEDTKTFYSSAENFEAQGETGTPSFTVGNTGLASWIDAPTSITLKKGEQVTVPFSIKIPAEADPGGHFAAIFLSTVPKSTDKGDVAVGAKVGVLVLLRVSGDVKEGGGIIDFTTQDKSRFFTTLPVSFTYRFNNSGNDRIKPEGTVRVTNTIGLEATTFPGNPNQGNILPGSTRRFELVWGPSADSVKNLGFFGMVGHEWSNFAFGKYTAHINLQYGSGKVSDAAYTIFVFPWQLTLVVLIILTVVLFVLFVGVKRYNRWIVKQASKAAGVQ